jgi:hypothetical protein
VDETEHDFINPMESHLPGSETSEGSVQSSNTQIRFPFDVWDCSARFLINDHVSRSIASDDILVFQDVIATLI